MQPWPLKELNSARREEGPGPGAGQQRETFTPRPLEHHIELGDQKVNVVTLLGLEGLCDDASRIPMLLAPQRQPVHFQDHVAHLELPTVVGGASSLQGQDTGQGRVGCLQAGLGGL